MKETVVVTNPNPLYKTLGKPQIALCPCLGINWAWLVPIDLWLCPLASYRGFESLDEHFKENQRIQTAS